MPDFVKLAGSENGGRAFIVGVTYAAALSVELVENVVRAPVRAHALKHLTLPACRLLPALGLRVKRLTNINRLLLGLSVLALGLCANAISPCGKPVGLHALLTRYANPVITKLLSHAARFVRGETIVDRKADILGTGLPVFSEACALRRAHDRTLMYCLPSSAMKAVQTASEPRLSLTMKSPDFART